MKKAITLILSITLCLSFNMTVYAAEDYTVSAENVSLTENESTLIPVKISSNKGIMGFKISVEYPVDKIEITSVAKGEVTTQGNFSTNFGINDGKFDVLWNDTENITKNGTLFVLSAKAKKEITKDTEIKLSFSQEDTFDVSWKDVKLNCKNIRIKANKAETTKKNEQNIEESTKKPNIVTPIDSSQVVKAVEIALNNNGYENLSDVKDNKAFIKEVNKNIEVITGNNDNKLTDMDSLKSMYNSAYEGEFISEITNNIGPEKIQNAIQKALDDVGAKTLDDVKDKTYFVEKVQTYLKSEYEETPNISSELDTEDAFSIIEKLYNSTNPGPTIDNAQGETEKTKDNKYIVIIVCTLALMIIVTTGFYLIKKRRKK